MLGTPFPPWPSFSPEEGDAVRDVLLSNCVNYWTGEAGRRFEAEFARWIATSHAVAVANGTVALDLALHALQVGPGDEVIVTPRTFIASVSSIVNAGAIPVFADVDRDSQNITPASVEHVLSSRTRAIMCVHLAGWPCDMNGFAALADSHGFSLIEDCAQAHGARLMGKPVGTLGDVAAWSFCQDKIMTTGGEGGMVTTNRHDLWSRIWSMKDHGKSWDAVYERVHPSGFRWLHDSFGTNFRMTEMQSTIGSIQLGRMDEWHARRVANAKAIWACADELAGLRVPRVPAHIEHAAYKCYVFVEPESLKPNWSRDRIVQEIVSRDVPCYTGSCAEVYRERAFEGTGWRPSHPLPNAHELGKTSLMFLVHPTLEAHHVARTCEVLREVMVMAVR